MNRYIISPSASKDLIQISNYFFTHNIQAGEKFFLEFNKKCQKLTQFPKMGRSYSDLRPNLRGLPLQGYIIIYQILENEVEILRIVHGSQDLELLFAEE